MNPVLSLPNLLAQTAPAASPSATSSLLMQVAPILLLFGAMWFLIIAPQRKKMKELKQQVDNLATGDEVLTNGGIYGTIAQKREDRFLVKISENTKVEVDRNSISAVTKKQS